MCKDFFGKPAFLTVSGQLNAETYATALSDVNFFQTPNCISITNLYGKRF